MALDSVNELLVFDGVGLPHLGQLSLHPRIETTIVTLETDDIASPGLIDSPDLDPPLEVSGVSAGLDGGPSQVPDLHVIIPLLPLKGSANNKLEATRSGAVGFHLLVVALKRPAET